MYFSGFAKNCIWIRLHPTLNLHTPETELAIVYMSNISK